jgi:hypothetical protein
MSDRTVVGLNPWLPWPLSVSRWWTEPVRAERLAVLRIGLAAVLLLDLLTTYAFQLHDWFGPGSLGNPEVFNYLADPPRWNWSLFRGFKDPLNSTLALLLWIVTTTFLLPALWLRIRGAPGVKDPPTLRWALILWPLVTTAAVLGQWHRILTQPEDIRRLLIFGPLVCWILASMFVLLGLWKRWARPREEDRFILPLLGFAWGTATALVIVGFWKWANPQALQPLFARLVLERWDTQPGVLEAAMILWVIATVFLLAGLQTRISAVVVWMLSFSFANLNSYIDNAGDTVRGIILFYLMLCPCGAAWSVDSWLRRRRTGRYQPVYVYPWPLRLLFVQLTLIYFCNGLYKWLGASWRREGSSLYYVLCDLTLTRYSFAELHLPYRLTQLATWTVMTWELTFPLLVCFRWTRVAALILGVLFHLGIFLSMELGGFSLYMLCLYLPLLPWERIHATAKPAGESSSLRG